MASYVKFQPFVENQLISGIDWNADTFKVGLTNVLPTAATDDYYNDITQISTGNGYADGGTATAITVTRSGGTAKVVGTDVVFTAGGGTIGPFQYAVLYKSTGVASTSPLVAYWAYTGAVTLTSGETFTVDFDATNGIFQMT